MEAMVPDNSEPKTRRSTTVLVLALVLGSAMLGRSALVGSPEDLAMDDAVSQYGVSERSTLPKDRCAYAGLMKAAYMRINDAEAASRWSSVEQVQCAAAELPKR